MLYTFHRPLSTPGEKYFCGSGAGRLGQHKLFQREELCYNINENLTDERMKEEFP